MATVIIKWKDKIPETVRDNGAPGGSYEQTVRYEGGFAIITDAYGGERAIPCQNIKEIEILSYRR